MPVGHVNVTTPDTDVTPYDQQTSSSRTTHSMGTAVQRRRRRDPARSSWRSRRTSSRSRPTTSSSSSGRVQAKGAPDRSVGYGELVRQVALGQPPRPARRSGREGGLDPETGPGDRLRPLAPGRRRGRGRGRPRDRQGRDPALPRRRLRRPDHQPRPGRAADRGQRRLRGRPGAVRGDGLRRRPAPERQPRRLHDREHRGHARGPEHRRPRAPRGRRDPRDRRDVAARRSCRRSATPSIARRASGSRTCRSPPRRSCAACARPRREEVPSPMTMTGDAATSPSRARSTPRASSTLTLRVNGRDHVVRARPHHTLLDVLRNEVGLTGPREGCGVGMCGACTVLVDGQPVSGCLLLAAARRGPRPGHDRGPRGRRRGARTRSSRRTSTTPAFQCSYCTPGFILDHEGAPRGEPRPDARRGQALPRRQPLPLRQLREDPRRRHGRQGAGRARGLNLTPRPPAPRAGCGRRARRRGSGRRRASRRRGSPPAPARSPRSRSPPRPRP